MTELKACPFCGYEEAEIIPQSEVADSRVCSDGFCVSCGECGALAFGSSESEAIAAWNRRHVPGLPKRVFQEPDYDD